MEGKDMIEQRYKVAEVAQMLRESKEHIYRGLHRGWFVGAYKIGGGRTSDWRIPESAIEAYLERCQR
ncbi:helix-turn-helix domain-containing protein [Rothia koreensis]